MPPKDGFSNDVKLLFADGSPVGKITELKTLGEDFDPNAGTTILQDDEFCFACEVDVVQTLRKNGFTWITHRALFSKKRRIRKKYEDLCWNLFHVFCETRALIEQSFKDLHEEWNR